MSSAISYRQDIDGLRGVAVLAVVVYHAFPGILTGGYIGVDVFFVISGFLISGIILEQLQRGSFSVLTFYERRIRRIFPALSIVLAASLGFGYFVLYPTEYRQLAKHTVAAVAFVSNFALFRESGYFDTAGNTKPLLHLWSLGIEEQFYLLWPLCLAVLFRNQRRLVQMCLGLAAVSFIANLVFTRTDQSAAFYLPFCRFWELLFGCIIAATAGRFVGGSQPRVRKVVLDFISVGGALLILAGSAFLSKQSAFPGYLALLPSLGAAMLIFAGEASIVNRTVLRSRPLVGVGLISYPLYLWHWPLLSFGKILLVRSLAERSCLVLLAIGLAWSTYWFVERPIRSGKVRYDLRALPAALACIGVMGFFVYSSNGGPWRAHLRLPDSLSAGLSQSENGKGVPCRMDPSEADLCQQSRPGAPTAAVVGDSHAHALFQGLAASDRQRNWLLAGQSGCPPTLGLHNLSGSLDCAPHVSTIFHYVAAQSGIKEVLLCFYGYYAESTDLIDDAPLLPSLYRVGGEPGETKEAALARGLDRSITFLLEHGKEVFLMIDVPELPFLPQDCVSRPYRLHSENCSVSQTFIADRQRGIRRTIERILRRHPDVRLFDPLAAVCSADPCRPVKSDQTVYRDNNHLSLHGSELVAESLLQEMARQEVSAGN